MIDSSNPNVKRLLNTADSGSEARGNRTARIKPAFDETELARLRSEGIPVFLYFTADWCLTCKVNERAALEQSEVASAFRDRGIRVMVGDWTRGDAAIGRFLERHGRSGVPFYLYYHPGREAEILPQILTVGRLQRLGS